MKTFKIRASEAGKIMASPKKNELPVGAQTYLREWYISEKYGRRMPVRTDQMDKGIRCEEQSISLLQLVEENQILYKKNDKNLTNKWATGTPDLLTDEEVLDIKTAWTFDTFWKAEGVHTKSGMLTDYGWQLMVYMWLTGLKNARLVYTLINTPEDTLIGLESAARWKFQGMDDNPEYDVYCKQLRKMHIFDDIRIDDRVRIWDLEYSEEHIDQLKARVELLQEAAENFVLK